MSSSSLSETAHELAQMAPGRCHSCAYQQIYELPNGPRYWCASFRVEMDQDQRDAVRRCPRWRPLNPAVRRRGELNPLFAAQIEAEDRLFWRLKHHLDLDGIDLKTLLVLSQPALSDTHSLGWVDKLNERFEGSEEPTPLPDILVQLRALGYESLCQMVEQLEGQE